MIRSLLDLLDLVVVAFLAVLFAVAVVPVHAARLVADRYREIRRRRAELRRRGRLGLADTVARAAPPAGRF